MEKLAFKTLYGILIANMLFQKDSGDVMLNQERVCEMTRLAIFDQKEGRGCRPMIQYFRKDYIAKELLKSFISGTAAYFIFLGTVALYYRHPSGCDPGDFNLCGVYGGISFHYLRGLSSAVYKRASEGKTILPSFETCQ